MNQGTKLTKKLTFLFIFLIAFSAVAEIQVVKVATANPMAVLPYITIKSDGSIEPQTAFIKQAGNVYTLTTNILREYAIKIHRSNIVFDGAGYSIDGSITSSYGFANAGLSVEGVTNVTVKDVEVNGFIDADIRMKNSNNSTFFRVKAILFYVENSDFNTIAESTVVDDSDKRLSIFLLYYSNNNTIMRNNMPEVVEMGGGYSNIFFENNFWMQQKFTVEGNFWDNGSVGNYWSGYKGVDANGDGIGDTPYIINSKDQDRFPLMNPWDPAIPYDTVPPRITILSPENKRFNDTSVPLVFSIYEPSSSMSYSLDGQDNVTVTGNSTLTELPNGAHNLTVYVTDRSGNVGVSEIISFSSYKEPEPSTLVVGAIGILATVIVGIGLVYYKKVWSRKRRFVPIKDTREEDSSQT